MGEGKLGGPGRPLELAEMPDIVKMMPNTATPAGPLVVTLAYDGLCTFEFGVCVEVFGLPRPEMGPGWYRHAVAAVEPGPLRAAGGLTMTVEGGLERLEDAHTIVVPGWRGIESPVPPALAAALRAANRRGARVMSLCSGIAVLAGAGLLDGRRATTHWRYVDAIRSRHPAIALDPDVLYVDEGTVLTAAGSAAGIDLCLHVVRRDFGVAAANAVARRLVVPPHRDGGQAQFIAAPVPRSHESGRLAPLIDRMRQDLGRPQRVEDLARQAGMSLRTFQRRFEETTGMAPAEWLLAERLRHARALLESGSAARLEDVAEAAGFGSLATMRHHFRQRLGTSPARYRERFSA